MAAAELSCVDGRRLSAPLGAGFLGCAGAIVFLTRERNLTIIDSNNFGVLDWAVAAYGPPSPSGAIIQNSPQSDQKAGATI
jgi:hypothetical protein